MKKNLCIITVNLIALLLSGCTGVIAVGNALDSSIPRKPFPDDGEYVVTLQIGNREPEVTRFRLENYYDAQGSTRGNYWSKRFVGSPSDERIKIKTHHAIMGELSLVLMNTQYIKKRDYPDFRAFFIESNGKTYWEPEDSRGVFFTRNQQGKAAEEFRLDYRIDIKYIPD